MRGWVLGMGNMYHLRRHPSALVKKWLWYAYAALSAAETRC